MARPTMLAPPGLVAADVQAQPAAQAHPAERLRLALVLLIALAQGVLYVALLPPWQHYDEPTHFEYAWLLANRPGLPQRGDEDHIMRRELAAAMAEQRFYWNLNPPTLLTDDGVIDVGIPELGHPPAYYLLVSQPLRLVRHLDLVSQLYVARMVSLLLFLATIAASAALLRELTPAGHDLRWAVPLAVALTPTFADALTAVNNDAGAALVFTLFLWGAARSIRRGLAWRRVLGLAAAAVLAAAIKNTAALALVLAPLAILAAFWAQRGWRWRWLAASIGLAVLAGLPLLLGWGDAAYWYRGETLEPQASATRFAASQATLGSHALLLELPASQAPRTIISPLAGVRLAPLHGQPATVGAWMWTDGPPAAVQLGLAYKPPAGGVAAYAPQAFRVTATPTFYAWAPTIPAQSSYLHYQITARAAQAGAAQRLFVDGAVLAAGAFAAAEPPRFDDAGAQAGEWGGRRFINLLRNASAEQGWPHVRAPIDRLLVDYIHRSPAQALAALLDIERIAPAFLPGLLLPATDGMLCCYAWGHVRLGSPAWLLLARAMALLALLGGLVWLGRRRPGHAPALRPTLIFLLLVGLLIWANTILRPLPLLGEFYIVPAARYTFPAISITALVLVGGWRSLWPARLQRLVTIGLLLGFVLVDAAAVRAIWSFYQALPG